MAGWRFLVFDARTRATQVELPVVGSCVFEDVLNGPGSFRATIPLFPSPGSPITMSMLTPPRAVFAVERDEVLLWAGPIWTHAYDIRSQTLTLAGEGYLSYLRRRPLRTTEVYAAVDQVDIACDLIDLTQALTGGDLGIDVDTTYMASGRLRDRTFPAHERKRIGTLIEQLGNVRDGFDFAFRPRWSNGPNSQLAIDFTTQFPGTGRETGLVFDLAATADIPSVTLDGTSLAYQVDALGQGQGDTVPVETAEDPALIAAELLLGDTVSVSDIGEADTLEGVALRRLDRGRVPIVIPRVEVSVDTLAAFAVGDRVHVRADQGLLQLDSTYRITSASTDVATDLVTVTCAPLEAFDADA